MTGVQTCALPIFSDEDLEAIAHNTGLRRLLRKCNLDRAPPRRSAAASVLCSLFFGFSDPLRNMRLARVMGGWFRTTRTLDAFIADLLCASSTVEESEASIANVCESDAMDEDMRTGYRWGIPGYDGLIIVYGEVVQQADQ